MRVELSTSNSQKAIPIPVQPLCPVVYASAPEKKRRTQPFGSVLTKW